jgi:hypothetical protein
LLFGEGILCFEEELLREKEKEKEKENFCEQ